MLTALVLAVLSVCRPWTDNVDERIWALDHGECYEQKWFMREWGRLPSPWDSDKTPAARKAAEDAWESTLLPLEPLPSRSARVEAVGDAV